MMTFEERMKIKHELEEELNAEPEIKPGDTIVIPRLFIRAKIEKIYYSFKCVEWHTEKEKYVKLYDVEFVDTKGIYRHWKSYFDGGYIEFANAQI